FLAYEALLENYPQHRGKIRYTQIAPTSRGEVQAYQDIRHQLDNDVAALYANPLLAHLPAVQNKRVYALGSETFRLDYYSATLLL
ncbi:trehalose-6-phosphate synthase, partial [Salmonella enterica subsp. enterica serovar Cerro]|nr:trehalose-6-phosphate synthase [Salmonella enterica subsp. enterica serovar Cerro]